MKFDLGIRVGHLLTMKEGKGEVQKDYFVGVEGNRIASIVPFKDELVSACKRFINAPDKIMIPGLINSHTHLGMSLFRGFEDDVTFHQWLFEFVFPVEAKLVDEEFVRVGSELSALECIRFGTTTVSDMYFFPEVTAGVLDRAGMRGLVGQHLADFIAPDEKKFGDQAVATRRERFLQFFEKYKSHPRIQPAIAPHAPYTCSDELIQMVTKISQECGIKVHMHVCETTGEVEESIQKFGKTPVKRLYDLGALHENLIAAHSVHLTDEEIELFKKTNTSVVYNPDANLKLSSGIAPVTRYRKMGIKVALGTDGAASNNDLSLFGAMDIGTKIQKLSNHDNTAMVALDALNMVTYEAAKVLGLQDRVGSIEVGKLADLVLLDTHHPHTQPLHSVLSQLVYAYQGLEVNTVICDGKILLENGHFKTLDPAVVQKDVDHMRIKIENAL